MVVAKISTVNIDGKILFSKNLVVWFILKNCLVCSIMQSLSLRLIRGGRTESLRRLEQLLSVCLIAMFIISVIILAFAVKQIMTARGRLPFHLLLRKFLFFFTELEQTNSELSLLVDELHAEIKHVKVENQELYAEIEQLHSEFKYDRTYNRRDRDEWKRS